jgi:hypothetical protein
MAGNVGGAEEECWNSGGVLILFSAAVVLALALDFGAAAEAVWLNEAAKGEDGEFESGWILRIKFIGALGLASARVKSPAVDVAEGGKGCWG